MSWVLGRGSRLRTRWGALSADEGYGLRFRALLETS
jgi:hypothetical protein